MKSRISILILFLIFAADIFIWRGIVFAGQVRPGDYFLDVGQGDAELIVFPSGARMLMDGGPDAKVVGALEKILPADDRYIDLMINSHPQLDHFGGFSAVLDSFGVGAFFTNGRDDTPSVAAWPALLEKVRAKNIPMLTLARGDSIQVASSSADVLSPDSLLIQSAELNDTGIVMLVTTPDFKTLLTADIGANDEDYLLRDPTTALLRADVLKVAHHGSKYSSSDEFLRAVSPAVAVIEVGAHNTYGQPASSTLARITSSTNAQIFRTDEDGTVEVFGDDGKLVVETER